MISSKAFVKGSLYLALIALFAALIFHIHAQGSGKYISSRDRFSVEVGIKTVSQEVELLKQRRAYLREKILLIEYALNDYSMKYDEILKRELVELEALAGKRDLCGPGVVIILKDGERELLSGESANNLLVHDGDLQQIVYDLRNAGAEAISINDERIILGSSEIICVGPVILVNRKHLAPPYIIKAIGDRRVLEATMNASGSFLDILKGYGLSVEINTSKYLEIKKLGGLIVK